VKSTEPTRPPQCWCGNRRLDPYSPEYRLCRACETLVSCAGLAGDEIAVTDDEHDFYGKTYWLGHQTDELGLPDIATRARADLPERCMYWLRTLCRLKPPPARVLDVGCAHGGFVALLRALGYDATGLELSPWVVDFARQQFGVPMLLGPIEEQNLPEASFDLLVLNDVLEHLPDPQATMKQCARLVKEDGALIVQTPCYPERVSYAELVAKEDLFLKMMHGLARQHLYLFSCRAARHLLQGLGLAAVEFLPALFPHDMYFVGARQSVALAPEEALPATLLASPCGRLCLALLDMLHESETREADRAARLEQIHRLHDMLREVEADREALRAANRQLSAALQITSSSPEPRPLTRMWGRWLHGSVRRLTTRVG
jgi:2-polyprenyl-3-methyl-5-hydroxy-6-metoxy-1,4-benzoquinol methylase